MRDLSPLKAQLLFAIFGAISGLLSGALLGIVPLNLPRLGTPMSPALWFGLVVAGSIYLWGGRQGGFAAIAFLGVAIGWIAAWTFAVVIYATYYYRTDWVLVGLGAGFIGAAITVLGAALAGRRRRWSVWLPPIAFGTVAGLLLLVDESSELYGFMPLFVVWQAGVAALIVRALRSPLKI